MSSRADLAAFFNTGDAPTESQFKDLIDSLRHIYEDADYTYKGMATSSTTPVESTYNTMYIASTPGTYTNFNSLVVYDGEVVALKWTINPTTQIGAWTRELLLNRYTSAKPFVFGKNLIDGSGDSVVGVEANGNTITAYQWESSHYGSHFADISTATSAGLTVSGTSPLLTNSYVSVRCKCTIGGVSVYTEPITITKIV